MPKVIELTIQIEVQRVSCPGVWLCQDGHVSLSVFTLGTRYQTCMLPPIFPLDYNDIFYFKRRYEDVCTLKNIPCMLRNETIYCELVQWCDNCCCNGGCTILAQYLGSLNDVLFPSNLCSNEGIDLLMRRNKKFPGILSPKIEISTKVRLDEIVDYGLVPMAVKKCQPRDTRRPRQRQVCHTPEYHRRKCSKAADRRSRASSVGSCCSSTYMRSDSLYTEQEVQCPPSVPCRGCSDRYNVYNANVPQANNIWPDAITQPHGLEEDETENLFYESFPDDGNVTAKRPDEDRMERYLLKSRLIYFGNEESPKKEPPTKHDNKHKHKMAPCTCEICRKYNELFQ